jgi:competence protein ComEC
VEAVKPAWTVFTVGYRNRFGHPKPDIVERYRTQGSALVRTDEGGAIRFVFGADRFAAPVEFRKQNPRYWNS